MPVTYADRVRAAASPAEALLAIAEGIDTLLAAKSHPAPADPWGSWPAPQDPPGRVGPVQDPGLIERLEEALRTETDGESRLALEAQLRLAREAGTAQVEDRGREALLVDEGQVELPPAGPEKQAARLALAQHIGLPSFIPELEEQEVLDAYTKGGPMWLYLGNREVVMQQPLNVRAAMVLDVEEDSPIQAQELARDILKSNEEGHNTAAIDSLAAQASE